MRNAENLGCKQTEEKRCEIKKAAIIVPRSLAHSALLDHRPCHFSPAVNL